jgi:hypothetical protein
MSQSFNILPSGDVENDGWTLVASSATTVWEILSDFEDDCHVRCPSYRGGLEVSFPFDVDDLPEGAVIDSITVFIKMATASGSGARGVTVNVLSSDRRSRYTTRSLFATGTPTTYEVGTYYKDPLGRAWDIHRLNKLRLRIFSHNNLADSVRIYQLYCRVNYHTRPSVTVTSPSGTVGTPSPTVSWSYSQLEGEPQQSAEYKVFTLTQASASTFNPDTAPAIYSATVGGIANSYTLGTSLNNDSYMVFVRATSEHNAKSVWASKQFTVSAPSPGVPGDNNAGVAGVPGVGIPTVVPDNYTSSSAIRMTEASNLMSVQGADFEIASDPIPFTGSNCTVARDTTQSFGGGVASMSLTASSAATMSATGNLIEVAEGKPFTVRGQFLAGATSRTVNLYARFYDAAFASVTGTVTATGTDVTSTWTEVVATGTVPAGAQYVEITPEVVSAANAEKHYVDHLGFMYGTNSAWTDGGHTSRNLLTSFLATGDDPASATDAWTQANAATTLSRVSATGTGAHGAKCNRMTYQGVSPSIAFRATSTIFNSTTSGTNFTLNKPAGVADNDLLLAFVTSTEFGTINPPSGWTAVNRAAVDDGSTDIALFVLKRTGLASDPSTWTTGTVSVASSRRTAVVVAYSGAAHSDDQFIAEGVKVDANEARVLQTATVVNNDPNAWRVAAFAANDDHTGMSMTANITAPTTAAAIQYVGKATKWSTSQDNTGFTINKPAGVQNGDLMIAALTMSGNVSTVNAPSGWTQVRKTVRNVDDGDAHSGSITVVIYKRTAGSSEPNSWSGSISGSDWGQPKLTQVVAYRNCETAANQFIAENASSSLNGSSVSTGSATNTDSRAWRVELFASVTSFQADWDSGDTSQRTNDSTSVSGFPDCAMSFCDSNGQISTGSHSRTAQLDDFDSYFSAVGWIGIIKPLAAPPAAGANETERVDTNVGSSNPWEATAVYDSNGVVAVGSTSVYGSLSTSDSLGSSAMASWIGLIKPAASIQGGEAASYPNTFIDVSNVDDSVFDLCENKLTVMGSFKGSASGTPVLTAEFYRANQLISSQSSAGNAFDTAGFTKSWAVFDIPEGTTRIRPVLSALDRAVSDTVDFDRVAVMLGALPSATDEPQWRDGTARPEHPVWSKPIIEYQENDGSGYGDWKPLAGQSILPPAYDLNTGEMFYVDHTIIPNFSRRYRVSTLSYGLNGDIFSSGFGPASQEAIFESRAWWLKDIRDLTKNMQVTPRWKDYSYDTANMSTTFQPIGADFPVVVSEGFKSDTFTLELHCESSEFTSLMKLLNSRRTLILQSDMDKMWWVRPTGNIQANVLATGSRQERPRRYVTVTFVQVAPEE